jgi:hypothetical protein
MLEGTRNVIVFDIADIYLGLLYRLIMSNIMISVLSVSLSKGRQESLR